MASVGEAHSCFLAQSSVTKLDIRAVLRASGETGRIENENVDAGIDDEAIEAQQPHVVDMPRIELGVMHV